MSWADDAKKRHDLAEQDAIRKCNNAEHKVPTQRQQFMQLMDSYNEIFWKILKDVGEAVWGRFIFSPSYEIVYYRQVYYSKNGALVASANWYVYSKAKKGYIGKGYLPEGWNVSLSHDEEGTILDVVVKGRGPYHSAVTLQTAESKLKEMMSICIERGPEPLETRNIKELAERLNSSM